MKIRTALFFFTLSLLLTACGAGQPGQTVRAGGVALTVKTDPAPLQVGRTAEISAVLEGAEGCLVSFRQYMPGMEMSSDQLFHTMTRQSPGEYHAISGQFSMGGDWQLEFQLHCDDEKHSLTFPYTLEWPE